MVVERAFLNTEKIDVLLGTIIPTLLLSRGSILLRLLLSVIAASF